MQTFSMDQLLPHRAPMQLVDEVIVQGDDLCVQAQVKKTHLFAQEQGVPTWVGIEIMAQAVAAITSYKDKCQGTGDVKEGMLLAVKRYKASKAYFAFEQSLTVTVNALSDEGPMQLFECQITGDNVSASGMLSVIQTAE